MSRTRLLNCRITSALVVAGVVVLGLSAGRAEAVVGPASPQPTPQTVSFTDPGTYTYTVLPNITSLTVVTVGASGGNDHNGDASQAGAYGGRGGQTSATLAVQPGEQLQVNVGGAGGGATYYNGSPCDRTSGGFNGGGSAGYGGETGGGASDVRSGAYGLDDRLVIGGGGAGAADYFGTGGAGGNPAGGGADDFATQHHTTGGAPGTQLVGGVGGTGAGGGAAGTAGAGGPGGCTQDNSDPGGGGGGGYFGGGGGAADYGYGSGGGGGSSYGPNGSTFTNGTRSGNGFVTLTFTAPAVGPPVNIQLSPASSTQSAGQSQVYAVHAFDVYGDDLGDVTADATFAIAGGSCTANSCSALPSGDHTVTAGYAGQTTTSTQTVLPTSRLVLAGLPGSSAPGRSVNLTVTARDTNGNVSLGDNGTVSFTSTDGNAVLPAPTALSSGTATVPITFNNGGNQTVTVTESGSGVVATSVPVAVTGAVSFSVTGFPATITAGQAGTVTVTALDAKGYVVTDYAGRVALSSSDANAVVPQPSALANGTGSFSVVLTQSGTQSITATSVGNSSLTGRQSGIQVAPGSLAQLIPNGLPSTPQAGSASSFTVQGADQYKNPVSTYVGTVHLTSTDSAATLSNDTAASNGAVSLSATLRTAGNQTLTFADTADASLAGSATVSVNAASASAVIGSLSGPTTAGSGRALSMTTVDEYGNKAVMNGEMYFEVFDPQANEGYNSYYPVGMVNGANQGNISLILKTAGRADVQIVACDSAAWAASNFTSSCRFYNGYNGGHAYTASFTTSVTPAAPVKIAVTGGPTSVVAGNAENLMLRALDGYGNLTDDNDALTFTSSDPKAALPVGAALTHGTFTGPVTLKTAGSQTVTAASTANAAVNGSTGPSTVTAAAAAAIALTGYPDGAIAGDHIHQLAATVTDAYGNWAQSYAGTLSVTTSDPQAVLPGPTAVTSGSAQVPVELRTAGAQTISVTDGSTPALSGSLSVAMAPASASRLVLTPADPTAVAGQPTQLTVTAQDAYGNVVTDDNAPVDVSSSDPSSSQPADVTLTSGTGVFSVTPCAAGATTITVATGDGIVSTTDTLAVTPGPAATLSLTGLPTVTDAHAPVAITVTAFDAEGNVASGDSGPVSLASSDRRALLPPSVDLAQGVTHVAVSFGTVGVQALIASAPGVSSSAQYATVRSVPSPPAITTTAASARQVALTWSPATSDGGAPITGYDVFVGTRAGSVRSTPVNPVPITDTSYTVSGLRNGTTYYFRVRAVNAVGSSHYSVQTSATPVAVPLAPRSVTAAAAGSDQITLSWTGPLSDGGSALLGYNVFVGTSAGGESSTPVNVTPISATSYTVSGLGRGMRYYFVVKAVNEVGSSNPSAEKSAVARQQL